MIKINLFIVVTGETNIEKMHQRTEKSMLGKSERKTWKWNWKTKNS